MDADTEKARQASPSLVSISPANPVDRGHGFVRFARLGRLETGASTKRASDDCLGREDGRDSLFSVLKMQVTKEAGGILSYQTRTSGFGERVRRSWHCSTITQDERPVAPEELKNLKELWTSTTQAGERPVAPGGIEKPQSPFFSANNTQVSDLTPLAELKNLAKAYFPRHKGERPVAPG